MFLQKLLLARALLASRHTWQRAFSYHQLVLRPSRVREGVVGLNDLPGRHAWITALDPSAQVSGTLPAWTTYLWDIAEVAGARYNRVSNGGCACRKPSAMRLARGWRPAGRWSTYNMAIVAQQQLTRRITAVNHSVVARVRRPDNAQSWVGRPWNRIESLGDTRGALCCEGKGAGHGVGQQATWGKCGVWRRLPCQRKTPCCAPRSQFLL
jgi:hypothetical protein